MQWVGNHINVSLRSHLTCSGVNAAREELPNDHPDHLGSSSFITDAIGYATQHLQYLPFGETFVDQKAGSFDSRYKFSAKEKDDETGYSYFGARYYDSDLSVWLSVDPLAKEYPSLSPYMYVAGNPVKLVDPDGKRIYLKGSQKRIDRFLAVLNTASEGTGSSARYSYNEKVGLQVTGVEEGDYFAEKMEGYSNSRKEVTLKLRNGGCFIDDFYSGKVDINDLENLGNPIVQQSEILHFTVERFAFPSDYDKHKWKVQLTDEGIGPYHKIARRAQGEFFNSIYSYFPGLNITPSGHYPVQDKKTSPKSDYSNFGNLRESIYYNMFGKILGSKLSIPDFDLDLSQ